MKIAILSLGLGTNYGGILQSYALQTVLQRMGHQVEVLDGIKKWTLPFWKKPFYYTYRFILKYIKGVKGLDVFIESNHNKQYLSTAKNMIPFIDTHIRRREIRSFEEIREGEYDTFVVGSDQVWRKKYFCGDTFLYPNLENAYLAFAKDWNVKRIVYAASFGTEEWEYTEEETSKCSELAKLFDAVSVREKVGVKLCQQYLGVEAKHVLDPTMLLSREDYEKIIQEDATTAQPNGSLLCYILDDKPETQQLIERVAEATGHQPFDAYKGQQLQKTSTASSTQVSIAQWLRNFRDSQFVITDSFHACVFSIIFNKPFVVLGNKDRGFSRFESLLGLFGIEHHLLTSVHDFDATNSYLLTEKTQVLWKDLQEQSHLFLKHSLECC